MGEANIDRDGELNFELKINWYVTHVSTVFIFELEIFTVVYSIKDGNDQLRK